MIENENGPLERMGNARMVLKTILDFGGVAAEVSLCVRVRIRRLT